MKSPLALAESRSLVERLRLEALLARQRTKVSKLESKLQDEIMTLRAIEAQLTEKAR